MSLFISQLLIISALGLMVQSAPINLTKRLTANNKAVLKNRLYCAAKALYNARGNSRSVGYNSDDDSAATKVFKLFSHPCQNFTIAMTLKYQLLDNIFNASTALDLNSKDFSTILTSLQTMANTFDYLEFHENNRRCLELSPAQYKMMYKAQYTTEVLESLQDLIKWFRNENLHPKVKNCN